MEPRSLLEENPTDIEAALLRAGRTDGPSQGATAHLLAMMQATAPGQMAGTGHAAPVEPAGLARWVKLGLLAVAVGGGAVLATHLARMSQNPPAIVPAVQEPAPAAPPVEAFVPEQAAKSPEVREGPTAAREEDRAMAARESQPRHRRPVGATRLRRATREASDMPVDHSLGNETRVLDRAREALDGHRPSEAMRVLEEYQRSFPEGRLRPESMILRLAVLVQAGRRGAADSLASQLLADEAYQTYAPRIRSLLGEAKP
jgi:hypothetical protein